MFSLKSPLSPKSSIEKGLRLGIGQDLMGPTRYPQKWQICSTQSLEMFSWPIWLAYDVFASGPDRKRGWSSGPKDRRSPSPRPLRRGPGTVGGKKSEIAIASFKSWMSNHENSDVNHLKMEFNHQKWELNSSTMTSWMSTSKIWCQQSEIGLQPPIFASSWDSLLIDGNSNGMLTQAWISSSKKWI